MYHPVYIGVGSQRTIKLAHSILTIFEFLYQVLGCKMATFAVIIHLKSLRRDLEQEVLYSKWLMRFGVILRFSVRAVVGSASEK